MTYHFGQHNGFVFPGIYNVEYTADMIDGERVCCEMTGDMFRTILKLLGYDSPFIQSDNGNYVTSINSEYPPIRSEPSISCEVSFEELMQFNSDKK